MVKKRRLVRRRKSSKKTLTGVSLEISPSIAREIWAIIYFSLGALTILSLQGAFGVPGDLWVGFLRPIVGWGIYVVPLIFLFVGATMFFAKDFKIGGARSFGLSLMLVSILSILHLSIPLEDIYTFAINGSHGGYIGFVTNFLFLQTFGVGEIGAAIVFVATFLVSLLLVFGVSLREIFRFMVPDIKIEVVPEAKGEAAMKKAKKIDPEYEDIEDEAPEILIHKSRVSRPLNADDVIMEEQQALPFVVDGKEGVVLNRNDVVKMSDALSENQSSSIAKKDEVYEWEFPSLDLLESGTSNVEVDEKLLVDTAKKIKDKLFQFGITVSMQEVNVGPTVIQYTLKPDEAVKLSKITALKNDLALAIAAERVRIEAPIPGKSLVGVEVPNQHRATVHLREILESDEFRNSKSKLTLPLGRNVSGKAVVASLETMPHLLIAGATGSGKSVGLNAFLISLLYQNSPKDLRMIMIDPKRVELNLYNSIPHLLNPVIEDPEKAAIALKWVVAEMNRRYKELSRYRVRNIFELNELNEAEQFPRMVVVIDELADLMMVAGKEVEASICRIAQMARAVGIHLIIATQRPSVDVITGLIKANIPARVAFAVSSSIDSRTILDSIGAEDLLGKGDMLYLPTGQNKPSRIQGIFVSTEEIERVTNRIRLTVEPDYNDSITSPDVARSSVAGVPEADGLSDVDGMYQMAVELVTETRKASASLFQRRLKVGYARAARLIDQLEENGVVGPADGAKPRKILVD